MNLPIDILQKLFPIKKIDTGLSQKVSAYKQIDISIRLPSSDDIIRLHDQIKYFPRCRQSCKSKPRTDLPDPDEDTSD